LKIFNQSSAADHICLWHANI
jgi:hypothetical protein